MLCTIQRFQFILSSLLKKRPKKCMQQSSFCESCKQYVEQHLRSQLIIPHIQANVQARVQAYAQTQAHCYSIENGGKFNMTSSIHIYFLRYKWGLPTRTWFGFTYHTYYWSIVTKLLQLFQKLLRASFLATCRNYEIFMLCMLRVYCYTWADIFGTFNFIRFNSVCIWFTTTGFWTTAIAIPLSSFVTIFITRWIRTPTCPRVIPTC
jgi:hypothetical protein